MNMTGDLIPVVAGLTLDELAAIRLGQCEQLLGDLNATQTAFPGTQLTLVFKLGSS